MKINQSTIDIGLIDLEGCFNTIEERLLAEGPIQIAPSLDFHLDESSPKFKLNFVPADSPTCIFCMFVVSFKPKFNENDFLSIEKWISNNRNGNKNNLPIVTLILNQPTLAWAFTTSRYKIEKKFKKRIPTSKTIIIKYISDSEHISSSDYQYLHSAIEAIITSHIETKIKDLLAIKLTDENFISVNSELAKIFMFLNYHSSSFMYAAKLRKARYNYFWPKSPVFYDISKELIDCYETGFDILCSSLSHTYQCAKKLKSKYLFSQFSDELATVYSLMLNNCNDLQKIENVSVEEKIVFTRNFIHYSSSMFCDTIETIDESICCTFALIALNQTIYVLKMKFQKNDSEFLKNIPSERKDILNNEQLLLSSWALVRKIFNGWTNNQKYFDSLFVNYLTIKNDKEGALKLFEDTNDSEFLKKTTISGEFLISNFEGEILEKLFEWKKDISIATSLISSNVAKEIKLEALKLLPKSFPAVPIHSKIHNPRFFTSLELFEKAPFEVSFKPPEFLVGESVKIFVEFESSINKRKMNSDVISTALNPASKSVFVFASSVNCIYSGTFDIMTLCVELDSSLVCWLLNLKQPLVVNEYNNIPEITVKSPYLISPNEKKTEEGEENKQVALILVENLDTECLEIGFTIDCEKESKIEFNNKFYSSGEEIVLTEFDSKLVFTLHVSFRDVDGISVNYRYVRKDNKTKNLIQYFEFHPFKSFQIRLFQQNDEVQQFQIVNPFPVEYTFSFSDGSHMMLPHSNYFILREKSDMPIELTFVEKGWEKYPVKIVTSSFCLNNVTCKVVISCEEETEWEVGEPREIEVIPSGSPIVEADNEDWVVASCDVEMRKHVFIPRRPGKVPFPQFLIDNQVADSEPESADIISLDFPIYVTL